MKPVMSQKPTHKFQKRTESTFIEEAVKTRTRGDLTQYPDHTRTSGKKLGSGLWKMEGSIKEKLVETTPDV